MANHEPTPRTPCMIMTLQAHEAPPRDNILAALFSWLTLAGFVVFPGTFSSVENSASWADSQSGKVVRDAVQHLGLLPFAGLCCAVGFGGTLGLWRKWRKNYVWLAVRLFMPGLLHSAVGLLNTLVNVYTSHGGYWSITAILTVSIIGLCLTGNSILTIIYSGLFEKMKTPYDRELTMQLG